MRSLWADRLLWRMITFMVSWAIARIPTANILVIFSFFLNAFFGCFGKH
jgi:hypothetical protein